MLNQHHYETTKALLGSAVVMSQMSKEDSVEILSLIQESIKKPKATAPEELLRTGEACKILKCSKPTLIKQARENGLQVIRFGQTLRFKKSEIFKMGGIVNATT